MQFGKTEEETTEGAMANLAEAALNEAANVAPEALRPHIKVSARAVGAAAATRSAPVSACTAGRAEGGIFV